MIIFVLANLYLFNPKNPLIDLMKGREGEKAGTLCEVLTSLDQVTESQVRKGKCLPRYGVSVSK